MPKVSSVQREELRAAAGESLRIIDAPEAREAYRHDIGDVPPLMTGALFETLPDVVVQPRTVGEVSAVLAWADRNGVPVIARGAASWGFGGVIPTRGGIVLDLSPFRAITTLDPEAKTVTVQAGARWSDIDIVAKRQGLALKTYPSSKFSTVGGWLATGGFGINSFRYGHVSSQVVWMTVVLASGEVRRLTRKDPDFHRFTSSEGEFGVIVEATLELRERPRDSFTHMLYFNSDDAAFAFVAVLNREVAAGSFQPNVIRFLDAANLRDTNEVLHAPIFKGAAALLLEFSDAADEKHFKDFLAGQSGIEEAPAYVSSYLWNERLFGMKTKRLGPTILASEVIIRIDRAAEFIARAKVLGARMGVEICVDSYVLDADRALVMSTFLCDSRKLKYYVNMPLVSMLTELGGRMGAAPYGLGIWNAPFIGRLHGKADVAALRTFKDSVDPRGILNPGKFFRVRSKWMNLPALAFSPPVFSAAMGVMAFGSPVMGRLFTLLLGKEEKVDALDAELSTHACAKCGNCIAVCPAYLVTGNEAVTAKGKLALARRIIQGKDVTPEEAENAFLCMHCKACESICQTNLELMDLWDAVEGRLERRFGRPEEKIRSFLSTIDRCQEYWEMVERNALTP